jgi:3-oxoacyl-ACP reductase-like protein
VAAFALLPGAAAAVLAALAAAGAAFLVRTARTSRDVRAFYKQVWRLFFCVYVLVPVVFIAA